MYIYIYIQYIVRVGYRHVPTDYPFWQDMVLLQQFCTVFTSLLRLLRSEVTAGQSQHSEAFVFYIDNIDK